MFETNKQLKSALAEVEQEIPAIEAAILEEGRQPELATGLAELWARRRLLRQCLRVRTVEAKKDVVDFRKWRDGDGSLQLIQARADARVSFGRAKAAGRNL